MKIATWNINGVRARIDNLIAWLKESQPDIVALQEIKCQDDAFPRLEVEALGYHVETHGQKGFNGVALLSKLGYEVHASSRRAGEEGDYLTGLGATEVIDGDLKEGDCFLHNDPYTGNSHAGDHAYLVPVFVDGEHLFTTVVKAHQADIGNSIPTTLYTDAKDQYEEGALIFPAVRVQRDYKMNDDIVRMCFSRIRVPDGRVLIPDQYLELAERHGLVTAIDNMLLFRCIQTLRRIRKSNASVGFFLNISHYTLADRAFFREFINLMAQNAELAPAIVFEFSQRAMDSADDALIADLDRLAQLGYRFSLDQVTHFDINPQSLSGRHFRYMKIEAERLIAAARAGALGDDPEAFKRMMDSYAIDLIADHIESEAMLLELLDLHLDFGQGYLFGEPRLARPSGA